MTNRTIKKVAVLGSGVMGSRIACHFANVGTEVLLLDIPTPVTPSAVEATSGNPSTALRVTPVDKNKIVNDALAAALKSSPSPHLRQALREAHQHRQLR